MIIPCWVFRLYSCLSLMSLLEQNVSDGQTKRTTPAQDQTMQNVQLIGWMKYSIATAPKYWSMDINCRGPRKNFLPNLVQNVGSIEWDLRISKNICSSLYISLYVYYRLLFSPPPLTLTDLSVKKSFLQQVQVVTSVGSLPRKRS